jgi:hypothetical protein
MTGLKGLPSLDDRVMLSTGLKILLLFVLLLLACGSDDSASRPRANAAPPAGSGIVLTDGEIGGETG